MNFQKFKLKKIFFLYCVSGVKADRILMDGMVVGIAILNKSPLEEKSCINQ